MVDSQSVVEGAVAGVVILLIATAIYIGRRLYNEKKQASDLESNNKILRLELEPPTDSIGEIKVKEATISIEEMKEATQIFLQLSTAKDSLEGSTAISSSQERKSSSINNSVRSSSTYNNTYNKRNAVGSISSSQVSKNGSQYDSKRISKRVPKRVSKRVSKRESSINSLTITTNSRKNIPPPPPPSPLKSRPNSVEIELVSSNILPSDTSNTTPPSSQTSSRVQLHLTSPTPSTSDLKAYSSRTIPQVFREHSNSE